MPESTLEISKGSSEPVHSSPIRLKQDMFDLESAEERNLADQTSRGLVLLPLFASRFPLEQLGFSGEFTNFSIFTSAVFSLQSTSEILRRRVKFGFRFDYNELRNSSREASSLHSNTLGFDALHLVYQGKQPLEIEGLAAKKGDNFLLVRLPGLANDWAKPPSRHGELSPDLHLQLDVIEKSIDAIRPWAKTRDVKFIALELPFPTRKYVPGEKTTTHEGVFSGKNRPLASPEKNLLVLTPQEFEDLTIDRQEVFFKAVEALGDHVIQTLVNDTSGDTSAKMRTRRQGEIERRLHSILRWQTDRHFNGPEVILERSEHSYAPTKERMQSTTYLRKTTDGYYFVKTSYKTGASRSIPLSDLLQIRDRSLDDILNDRKPFQQARLALFLHTMLQDRPLDELLQRRTVDVREVERKLREQNFQNPLPDLERERTPKERIKTFIKPRQALLSFLIANTVASGIQIYTHREQLAGAFMPSQSVPQESFSANFGEVPKGNILWRIDAEHGFERSGYYITGTSRTFQHGQWDLVRERTQELHLPKSLESSQSQGILRSLLIPNLLSETRLKIPIKDQARLAALSLIGPEGQQVPFSAYELVDGTVEVVIPQSAYRLWKYGWIDMTATLVPSESGQVHATGPLEPRVDFKFLTDKAHSALEQATKMPGDVDENIAEIVRSTHTYAINPKGKEQVEQAQSAEGYVNAALELPFCQCNVCNTQSVLLASASNKSDMNIAIGFLGIPEHPDSLGSKQFLRANRTHAFGIDAKGKIIDATASVAETSPSDASTEVDEKKKEADLDNSLEKEWQQTLDATVQHVQEKENLLHGLLVLSGLATATGGFFLTTQLARFLRRTTAPIREKMHVKNVRELSEKFLLEQYSMDDLTRAFNFFSRISHGRESSTGDLAIPIRASSKEEAVRLIQDNIDLEKVSRFIKNPQPFEKAFGEHALSLETRLKLRTLAVFLR
ncbi:MAG: hypothetical protein Q8R11_02360 [bacterium]|nr:hypothetical protein [bacterium]